MIFDNGLAKLYRLKPRDICH